MGLSEVGVNLGAMTMKEYSTYSKVIRLEPHYQRVNVRSWTIVGGGELTPLQRCSQRILLLQPTELNMVWVV